MSGHAGDGGRCRACGARIEWISDWRGRLITLDARPSELRRPTFVEVEMGEFVEVHRHECEPPPPKPPPYDGRDVRPKKEPKPAKPEPAPDLFADSLVRSPMSATPETRTADVAA